MNDRSVAPELRVARFIEKAAAAERVEVLRWQRLSGGAIQQNIALDARVHGGAFAGEHRWVVRTDAASQVSVSHSRAHEFALLRAAHEAGVRVALPLWLCEDGAGPDFFVMDRVPGIAAGHRLTKDDALVADRAALARELGANLARIHRIRPPCPDLAFLGEAPARPALERIAHYRGCLDALGIAGVQPVLEWGLRWCELHAPAAAPCVLLHRDYRTGNYLVHEGRLAAVLDWEFAGWGDPVEDIGWFFARCWRFAAPARIAGGVGEAGDFLAGYAQGGGGAVREEDTRYWQVMAHIRWAVIALQQAERHRSGAERSLELALTAHIVPELEWEILALTSEMP
ncbi:MAG TPA: phosphotransferase family protein [Usitatibacter sp.]|nr:phosphotransferase family protein [Usitatibacter sp.]